MNIEKAGRTKRRTLINNQFHLAHKQALALGLLKVPLYTPLVRSSGSDFDWVKGSRFCPEILYRRWNEKFVNPFFYRIRREAMIKAKVWTESMEDELVFNLRDTTF